VHVVLLKQVLQNGVQALQADGELEPAGLSVPPGHGLQVLLPNPAQVPAGHSAKHTQITAKHTQCLRWQEPEDHV
jgi:hypothetical protein